MKAQAVIRLKNKSSYNKAIACTFFFLFFCRLQATPLLRLSINGPGGIYDETVVYYQQGATDGFDAAFDSYKLVGPNPAPHIAQQYGAFSMQINGISPVVTSFSIPIRVTTNTTGFFTLRASDYSELPAGTSVCVIDRYTNDTINLLERNYEFNMPDTAAVPRFILCIKAPEGQVATGMARQAQQPLKLAMRGDRAFLLERGQASDQELVAELVGVDGKTVQRQVYAGAYGPLLIKFENVPPGIYLLKLYAGAASPACCRVLFR